MSYHPMRRDLWTNPQIKEESNQLWREYARHHRVIDVDCVTYGNTDSDYKRITGGVAPYVKHVDDNWADYRTKGRRQKDDQEDDITVVFSNSDDGSEHEMCIKPSTFLRELFTDYAESNGVSLRSLRFTFRGSTVFLSALGRKTVKDLNMNSGDCVSVSNIQEVSMPDQEEAGSSKKGKQPSNRSKGGKSKKQLKQKSKRKPTKVMSVPTEEEAKVAHSISLSKLFEEAEPKFKAIRQRLNKLVLECKCPKARSQVSRKRDASPTTVVFNPNTVGLAGKAGKTSYTVNVGQVENLYISSKRSSRSQSHSKSRPSIDLHGCTKDEALTRLDDALTGWVDVAMKGEYPWVVPVDIICGGGSQVLSEAVEGWIKGKKNVANAPKGSLCQ